MKRPFFLLTYHSDGVILCGKVGGVTAKQSHKVACDSYLTAAMAPSVFATERLKTGGHSLEVLHLLDTIRQVLHRSNAIKHVEPPVPESPTAFF